MKSGFPEENIFKLLMKKAKNPLYIALILFLYFLNDHIKIIETKEIAIAVCVFLACIVLLKDTIYKCLDRWCKRDETIEKEKTKRILATDNSENNDNNPSPNNTNDSSAASKGTNKNNNDDVKVYHMKNRRSS